MFKMFFKILFRLALAAAAVFAVFTALQYFDSKQSDYIEIYNDDNGDGPNGEPF